MTRLAFPAGPTAASPREGRTGAPNAAPKPAAILRRAVLRGIMVGCQSDTRRFAMMFRMFPPFDRGPEIQSQEIDFLRISRSPKKPILKEVFLRAPSLPLTETLAPGTDHLGREPRASCRTRTDNRSITNRELYQLKLSWLIADGQSMPDYGQAASRGWRDRPPSSRVLV